MPTVLSMTVVLFLLGFLLLIFFHANELNKYYRENFEIRVYLHSETDVKDGLDLTLKIKSFEEVKQVEFISKEDAAALESKEQGIDFVESLGYNPLPHSIRLWLNSDYSDEETVNKLLAKIKQYKEVEDIGYQENLLGVINQNLKTLQWMLFGLIGIFLIAALLIINSTIRLNIFARRFLIKSMQFVGATDGFIMKPILRLYLLQGLVASIFAITLLSVCLFQIQQYYPGLVSTLADSIEAYLIIAALLIFTAIVFILPATWLATRTYLRSDINKLY
jgi:cell division transport system permease protein